MIPIIRPIRPRFRQDEVAVDDHIAADRGPDSGDEGGGGIGRHGQHDRVVRLQAHPLAVAEAKSDQALCLHLKRPNPAQRANGPAGSGNNPKCRIDEAAAEAVPRHQRPARGFPPREGLKQHRTEQRRRRRLHRRVQNRKGERLDQPIEQHSAFRQTMRDRHLRAGKRKPREGKIIPRPTPRDTAAGREDPPRHPPRARLHAPPLASGSCRETETPHAADRPVDPPRQPRPGYASVARLPLRTMWFPLSMRRPMPGSSNERQRPPMLPLASCTSPGSRLAPARRLRRDRQVRRRSHGRARCPPVRSLRSGRQPTAFPVATRTPAPRDAASPSALSRRKVRW
jgi:hypothetical protein